LVDQDRVVDLPLAFRRAVDLALKPPGQPDAIARPEPVRALAWTYTTPGCRRPARSRRTTAIRIWHISTPARLCRSSGSFTSVPTRATEFTALGP
jgi:hypothetical protein